MDSRPARLFGRTLTAALCALSLVAPGTAAAAGWALAAPPSAGDDTFLFGVSCPAASTCVAVGASAQRGSHDTPAVERWDGTSWTVDTLPHSYGPYGQLESVSCPSATSCMAVGRAFSEVF